MQQTLLLLLHRGKDFHLPAINYFHTESLITLTGTRTWMVPWGGHFPLHPGPSGEKRVVKCLVFAPPCCISSVPCESTNKAGGAENIREKSRTIGQAHVNVLNSSPCFAASRTFISTCYRRWRAQRGAREGKTCGKHKLIMGWLPAQQYARKDEAMLFWSPETH